MLSLQRTFEVGFMLLDEGDFSTIDVLYVSQVLEDSSCCSLNMMNIDDSDLSHFRLMYLRILLFVWVSERNGFQWLSSMFGAIRLILRCI